MVQKIKSCGFLIYRTQPRKSLLLMKHPKRWDLPKGHVDDGESNLECAIRELEEETGISSSDIRMNSDFKYKDVYIVTTKRGIQKKKKLIIYLAELIADVEIVPTEHEDYEWIDWNPPHSIQEATIDPLLAELEEFWSSDSVSVSESEGSK